MAASDLLDPFSRGATIVVGAYTLGQGIYFFYTRFRARVDAQARIRASATLMRADTRSINLMLAPVTTGNSSSDELASVARACMFKLEDLKIPLETILVLSYGAGSSFRARVTAAFSHYASAVSQLERVADGPVDDYFFQFAKGHVADLTAIVRALGYGPEWDKPGGLTLHEQLRLRWQEWRARRRILKRAPKA